MRRHRIFATVFAAGVATAMALCTSAAGAYAAWNDSAPLGTASITTGSLSIDRDQIGDGTWHNASDGSWFDPSSKHVTAGSTLTYTVANVPVTVVGDNLEASFEQDVTGAVMDASIRDHLRLSLASDPGTIDGSATGTQAPTLTLTLAADSDLPAAGETIDLTRLTVTLSNGRGWADTVNLNAGTLSTAADTAPGGVVSMNFNLTGDADKKVGFYLTDPGAGTTINWGPTTTTAKDGFNESPAYSADAQGAYVQITGTFEGFGSSKQTVAQIGGLTHVEGWNDDIGSTSAQYAFLNASKLQYVESLPDGLTDTSYAFKDAGTKSANAQQGIYIDSWTAEDATTMAHMFDGASTFAQQGISWNTAKVTDMSYMFAGASSFQGPLRFTSTAAVTTMKGMFQGATNYTSAEWSQGDYIQAWDVSHVTDMSSMFKGAAQFDRNLSAWDTSRVTDMSSMFAGASTFNQDLPGWNTSHVVDMSYMFAETSSFRGDIREWSLAKVTTTAHMFENSHYDYYSLGDSTDAAMWDVSGVKDMSFMFAGSTYDKTLKDWDVSGATTMVSMFERAAGFHDDLSTWKDAVANVAHMDRMFYGATSFAADLSGWDVSTGVTHVDFSTGAGALVEPDWVGTQALTEMSTAEPTPTAEPSGTPSESSTETPEPAPSSPSDDSAASTGTESTETPSTGTDDTASEDAAADDTPTPAPKPTPAPTPSPTATTGALDPAHDDGTS